MVRNHLLPVKLTVDEKRLLRELADQAGETVSDYVRKRSFSDGGAESIYRAVNGREYRAYKPLPPGITSAPEEERRTNMKRKTAMKNSIEHVAPDILARFVRIIEEKHLESFNELFEQFLKHYDEQQEIEAEANDPERTVRIMFENAEETGVALGGDHFAAYLERLRHTHPEIIRAASASFPRAASNYGI